MRPFDPPETKYIRRYEQEQASGCLGLGYLHATRTQRALPPTPIFILQLQLRFQKPDSTFDDHRDQAAMRLFVSFFGNFAQERFSTGCSETHFERNNDQQRSNRG